MAENGIDDTWDAKQVNWMVSEGDGTKKKQKKKLGSDPALLDFMNVEGVCNKQ